MHWGVQSNGIIGDQGFGPSPGSPELSSFTFLGLLGEGSGWSGAPQSVVSPYLSAWSDLSKYYVSAATVPSDYLF